MLDILRRKKTLTSTMLYKPKGIVYLVSEWCSVNTVYNGHGSNASNMVSDIIRRHTRLG